MIARAIWSSEAHPAATSSLSLSSISNISSLTLPPPDSQPTDPPAHSLRPAELDEWPGQAEGEAGVKGCKTSQPEPDLIVTQSGGLWVLLGRLTPASF